MGIERIEKKLDALIDALGFDAEETRTRNNEAYYHDLKAYGGLLGMMPANGRNYITTEFKLSERDNPKEDANSGYTATEVLALQAKRHAELIEKMNTSEPIPKGESTAALKHKLLTILKKAGKEPKKATIALMSHEIDSAFNKRNIDCTVANLDFKEDERDYLFMKEIKALVIKSGIPKIVIHDLIDGIIHE